MKDKILKLLNDSINTKSKLISDNNFLINVEQAVDNCIETITKGNTIFFAEMVVAQQMLNISLQN